MIKGQKSSLGKGFSNQRVICIENDRYIYFHVPKAFKRLCLSNLFLGKLFNVLNLIFKDLIRKVL